MKLIYLSTAIFPSALANRIQTMKMAEAFSQFCDFKLFVGGKKTSDEEIFNYYDISKRFEIIVLGIPKIKPRVIFSLPKYLGVIKKENPDIIFIRELRLALLLRFFYKNIIFEAHSLPRNYFLYSNFFKKVKNIITITQGLKNFFIQKGVCEDKILVAPDGVDINKFNISLTKDECRKKLDLPLNKKIILYTGHLYKWKGVDILAEASKFLPENCLVYFVGGTGEDIKKFKANYGRVKNIKIIGQQHHYQIPYWLRASDVLILPNSGKEEISKNWTSPIKMFEYMASGTPIIASDLPSLKEILNHSNALLVKPDDEKDLAGGIKKVLKNPLIFDKISFTTLEDVKKYSWDKRAENIVKFILKI